MVRLPLADRLRVRTPCTVGWDTLESDGSDRFCDHCNMHVHDVASMTRAEAERLVRRREEGERVCLHLHVRRSDGAILVADGHVTREEPRAPRTRTMAAAVATATMLSACASTTPTATRAAAPASEVHVENVAPTSAPSLESPVESPIATETAPPEPPPVDAPEPTPPVKRIAPAMTTTTKHPNRPKRPADYEVIDGGAW